MLLNKRIPVRYLLGTIKWELIIVIIWAIIIMYFDEYIKIKNLSIPLQIPTILGTTISLILAFRTGQSYERWWEARKIWGSIVNDSRSLIRQVLAFPTNQSEEVKQIQRQIAELQIEWSYTLGERLRGFHSEAAEHQRLLHLPHLFKNSNVPNAILSEITMLINKLRDQGHIDAFQYIKLNDTVQLLTDSMGGSERIKFTVFPRLYSMFVDVFLYVFIIILPFGIIDYFSFLEAPVIIIISVSFLILEKTAILLQDPFSNLPTDVPVTTIAQTIERNINDMMGNEPLLKSPGKPSFYNM